MHALSVPNLLEVWEQGQGEPGYRRALLLLAAACPEESPEALSQLSIGGRDARLLTLRTWIFGRRLDGIATCPACGEQLEFSLEESDLRSEASERTNERFEVAADGYTVKFRMLNAGDLTETARHTGDKPRHVVLMERCVLEVRQSDERTAVEHLPPPVFEALTSHMARVDPQADIQLALACPACEHRWHALFDIVSFFWREIHAWAIRTLREVHLLASAYGWQEADILAMNPLRRRLYLEMVAV